MLVNTVINNRICYVEMQNADHFNCLSEVMCQELCNAIRSGYDQECVAVVIKAQCKKGVWSAGHDIRELPQNGDDPCLTTCLWNVYYVVYRKRLFLSLPASTVACGAEPVTCVYRAT